VTLSDRVTPAAGFGTAHESSRPTCLSDVASVGGTLAD